MTCLACGAELEHAGVGRPRRFCSTACRVRAHRDPDVTKLAISRTIVTDLEALASTGQRFGAILADPPWRFETYSDAGKGRSAEQHYATQTLDDIKAMPVASIAADDCALFLWVTMPMLPAAFEIMEAWGFTYKTAAFVWAKIERRTSCRFSSRVSPLCPTIKLISGARSH